MEEAGEIVLGIVLHPMNNELFWAEKGKGAWLNDKRIHVSTADALSRSLLATGIFPDSRYAKRNNIQAFHKLMNLSHGVHRDGSAALDLCFVACGRLDGFWDLARPPWDVAAGSIIVTEAGGMVSDLCHNQLDLSVGNILATNGSIHDNTVEALEQTPVLTG